MELLAYPKTDYLLTASLETLHAESREWLKEIDFWKDEIAFFYKLIRQKKGSQKFPAAEVTALEKELIRVSNERMEKLYEELQNHEVQLAHLFKEASFNNEDPYRKAHSKHLNSIYELNQDIKDLKRKIFSLTQKYE